MRSTTSLFLIGAAIAHSYTVNLATFDGVNKQLTHKWMEENDPVMGGASNGTFSIKDNVAIMDGNVNLIPRLQAPGFIQFTTADQEVFPDVSGCKALSFVVRSTTNYSGYRVSIGKKHPIFGKFFASGFKAPFSAPMGDFAQVTIPFDQFSDFWDDATGKIIHSCASNSWYCPDAKTLANMNPIRFWAEGVDGEVHLEVKTIDAVDCTNSSERSSERIGMVQPLPHEELPSTPEHAALQWSCPGFLKPFCSLYNITECASQCKAQLTACTSDTTCRSSLAGAGECMATSQFRNTSAQNALTCLIPDNQLRDAFFQCLLETHQCIDVPQDGPIYPKCRDTQIAGASSFAPSSLAGDWWKVSGWTKGEPYECRPCSKVQFWNASLSPSVPGGKDAPSKTDPETMIISSTWQELDPKGKVCQMNDTSYFGPRPARYGFPAKMQHYGAMLGLSYQENFTVVHDGTQEAEPFLFLYGCGESLQGAYTTGLVLATVPEVSATLQARIGSVASANGFDAKDWCEVDNSCAKH